MDTISFLPFQTYIIVQNVDENTIITPPKLFNMEATPTIFGHSHNDDDNSSELKQPGIIVFRFWPT